MQGFIMSMREKKVIYLLLLLVCIGVSTYGYYCVLEKVCKSAPIERIVRGEREITLPKGVVYAEVADTEASRTKGLSGRSGLKENEGLLFVFDHPGKYGFWMKDMLFAIDIIWIAEDGTVVHIEREVSPSSYFEVDPPQTFANKPDAKYVLELASGVSAKYGVYLGTKVTIGE